jgi:nucleoid-associated protein EbfC
MSEPIDPDDAPQLPDLGGLLDSLNKVQVAQGAVYEGQAGGGVVHVRATGSMQFESVSIAPDAVDPDDVEMLEDLVLAALHDLTARIAEAQRAAMGGLGNLDLGNLDLGNLDLGGLGGLGGLGPAAGEEPGGETSAD